MKLFSLLFLLTTIHFSFFSAAQPSGKTDYPIGNVMLTIPGNPATSAAVSWQSVAEDTSSIAQLVIADASPFIPEEAKTLRGTRTPPVDAPEIGRHPYYSCHKIVFEDLQPGTQYMYRVGNGTDWSEWFHFKTAAEKAEPFSFLYLGDFQNGIKTLGSRVIRQAYSHFPDSRFMLFAGDLVNRSTDADWQEYFHAGGWIFGMLPSLPTPGNHEYTKVEDRPDRVFSTHWSQLFTLPENGPSEKFNNRVYFMDYQGVRFISMDSPAMGKMEDGRLILDWLDQTLASNPHKWAVVFTHYPIYSCSQGRDSEIYREAVKPVLEKHGVDLVLQGHDHTYCRGRNMPHVGEDCPNPPMYVVSVAGAKMYGVRANIWANRIASETQLYQHIAIAENILDYRAFTATGALYDGFRLIKRENQPNRVIENPVVKTIPERISIQERRRDDYSEAEIEKIEERMDER